MADFLIELAQSGRQVIVETHSEHILLRVRRRLLSDPGLSPDDVSLIHIGKDASLGGSDFADLNQRSLGEPAALI